MKEAKLTVFPDSLEYRFADPGWHSSSKPAPLDELLAQARAIDAERCQRLTISGGSPLKHPSFVELAIELGKMGFRRLAVQTDGVPLARKGATALLKKLGFSEIFLVVGGVRESVQKAVMNDDGAVRPALEGLARAAAHDGDTAPRVYLVAPLLRSNVDDLDALVDWAIGLRGLNGVLLSLPEIDRVAPEYRDQLLPYSAQAEVAARLFLKCQGHNVEYGFTSKRGIIPCAAGEALERYATVFYDRAQFLKHSSHRENEFSRVDACESCSLVHSCDGIETEYLDLFGSDELAAVPLERSMGWKLRKINKLEDFEYRNISPFKNDHSAVNPRGLIRINGHCNMSCSFCFVDRTAPDFDSTELEKEIRQMADGGTKHLVLSGGEPTLHPQLAELIAFAKSLDTFDVIEMQSNGVKCADLEYARELVDAGLQKVTFSLHSVDPEHSDSITRLPNAFGKTMQAIHNFRELGILTQIAHVLTKSNYKELPSTVRYLREEFPADGGHLSICLAIAQGISDLVFEWVIPKFSDIKPFVSEALDYCLETKVGFGGMIGQGGYPPCMLDGDMRYYNAVLDKVFKSEDAGDQFFKPEKCKECSFDPYCLGPRRSYVEHYGDAEIKPFTAEIAIPSRGGGGPSAPDYSAEAATSALAESVAPSAGGNLRVSK